MLVLNTDNGSVLVSDGALVLEGESGLVLNTDDRLGSFLESNDRRVLVGESGFVLNTDNVCVLEADWWGWRHRPTTALRADNRLGRWCRLLASNKYQTPLNVMT